MDNNANPVQIMKLMFKIGEDGFPILSPDIDINVIMKQCSYF